MKTIIALLLMTTLASSMRIDFGEKSTNNWYVLNDGVMGGLSTGKAAFTKSALVLKGTVSLENNGGFASVKSPFEATNLADYKTVTVRYRSAGQTMALTFETSERWYDPTYKAMLPTSKDWSTATFELKDFQQYKIGRASGATMSNQNQEDVIRMGFMTADKKAGDFMLEVDFLEFN